MKDLTPARVHMLQRIAQLRDAHEFATDDVELTEEERAKHRASVEAYEIAMKVIRGALPDDRLMSMVEAIRERFR